MLAELSQAFRKGPMACSCRQPAPPRFAGAEDIEDRLSWQVCRGRRQGPRVFLEDGHSGGKVV